MAKPIDQQVVVITGASSGIGRETALRLASKGARVVVSARREESLDELIAQIRSAGGEATSAPADVSVYSDVEALANQAVTAYGRIDTWVNNAAVLLIAEFVNAELDEARRLFDVNFWGVYHGCRAALPIMLKQGYGTIINVSSVEARRPLPLSSAYSASKAAVNGLSEALRSELTGTGIEVCIVMPATIDTPLFQHSRSKEGYAAKPFPPIYPPSEAARAIEKCAVSPQRQIFAGPAGQVFSASNTLMPNTLDRVLAGVIRPAQLTKSPEPPRGRDNLDRPLYDVPATSTGGWRTPQYMGIDVASRVALGLGALLLLRRLGKKR
jgi:NAD(P)-dependent dehydrogenase (short-subunit alcohol dehydrogenase family)